MTRKVTLSKDTPLWEEGDGARNIAIVDSGKLGIIVNGAIIGLVWPKMVIGESAIWTSETDQAPERRKASVIALEEGTTVSEYPASMVRRTFIEGSHTVTSAILTSLVGQICRNCLMIITANQHRPIVNLPFKATMEGLLQGFREQVPQIAKWEDFMLAFKVLYTLRNSTEAQREQLVSSRDPEMIQRASTLFRDIYKQDSAAYAEVESYLKAEREKGEWLSNWAR